MTPRQRLLTTLAGGIPDCVPVAPDFSNMIPARLTGKPFWDLYLYHDPPIYEAYIACARQFGIDALMDGYFPLIFPEERQPTDWEQVIVERAPHRLVVRQTRLVRGEREWSAGCDVFPVADPPTVNVPWSKIDLPETPARWEDITGVKPVDLGPEGLKRVKRLMGDQGLVGVFATNSTALSSPEDIYRYQELAQDDPDAIDRWAEQRVRDAEIRVGRILALAEKPDFICVGGSGTLIFQSPAIFRRLAFPAVKRAIELATAAGLPTHIHSCGPEKTLVKIMAQETGLTVIDPLEIPPMGDCDLAALKRDFGQRLTLKGNLHTTQVMLMGSVADVVAASRQAIDDAATGGRFILSTGDQCGRDTPDDNLRAMIDTARTYGRYRADGTVVGGGAATKAR
jgi:uroporphyrinogen decarboxylase